MKHSLRTSLWLAALAATLCLRAADGQTGPGYVDFGKFAPPGGGGQFIEVHVKNNLIAMVARLAEKQEPEVAELLKGLEMVRVNVIGLKDSNRAEVKQRVGKIRAALDAQGWERVVTVQEANEDVGVYVKTRGSEAFEGVVVTVIDGDQEAVLVNVVGNIRPEQLSTLGERFDLEPLKKLGVPAKKS